MKNIITTSNNTVYQPKLLFNFDVCYDRDIPENDISRTVAEVVEGVNIFDYIDLSNRNTHGYDGVHLLEAVLLSKTLFGYASTRELQDLCAFDIRFKFIMRGEAPSHMTFQRFINHDLKKPVEDIFFEINRYIEKKDEELNTDILYIDGSKFEANANKMTFVWKKASIKYRSRIWEKIDRNLYLLNKYLGKNEIPLRFSVLKEPNLDYSMEICEQIEKLMKERSIEFVHGKGCRKHEIQKFYETFRDLSMNLFKYTIQFDIFGERNSFSKTDPDATFMHMKYDYYNHTNVFKPGYNVQIGVSYGYIRNLFVSSDCNDVNTYIPFMESYYEAYEKYPKKTPADAGYGSFDNYKYCREKEIDLYMKYNTQAKEKEKLSDKNRFKTYKFEINDDDEIICPAGHAFTYVKSRKEVRGMYEQNNEIYVNEHCEGCPLRSQCTRSKDGRSVTRNHELEDFHLEVRDNMSTEEGIEIMKQRSIQAEGVFGQIKEDYKYTRLRRRGIDGVKEELYLVAIGHNLRRYHKRKFLKQKNNSQMS